MTGLLSRSWVLFLIVSSIFTSSQTFAQDNRPVDTHYCDPEDQSPDECTYNEAIQFLDWSKLSARQTQLLEPYLAGLYPTGTIDSAFADWSYQHDDQAAAFVGMTYALTHLVLVFADGTKARGLDMVAKFVGINEDHIVVQFDPTIMNKWKDGGGQFIVNLANGKVQTGSFDLADHTVLGEGELFSGFDFQWFSGVTSENAPRFHFNFRLKDNVADMHLDVAVWIWGFIPNPDHMTYGGSDLRQFYDDFQDRFGNAGFQIQERVIPGVPEKQKKCDPFGDPSFGNPDDDPFNDHPCNTYP